MGHTYENSNTNLRRICMKRIKCLLSVALVLVMLVSFAVPVSANELPFTDVTEEHEAYDAIKFVYDNGLMYGATETKFNPSGTLMRAMIVTILWRHAGEPMGYADPGFTDVYTTDFFYDAVCWAAELGITTGTTATTFDPYRNLTLLETLIFLYRYAHHEDCCDMTYLLPEPNVMTNRIGDSRYDYSIPEGFGDAVDWAVNCGVVDDELTYFNGFEIASRAVCANYLYKFMTLALGDGKVFATSVFEKYGYPFAEPICGYMDEMGYEAEKQFDLYPIAMRFAFSNSKMIYSHAHGGKDAIELADGKMLRSGDIAKDSMKNVDLVYLSSCHAGNGFLKTLCSTGGAKAGVGFTDKIYISVDPDGGIYYFDKMFFFYLREQRHSIKRCCEMALLAAETRYGRETPFGSGNYTTYGEFQY